MNGRNTRREQYEDLFFQVLLDEMLAAEESEGNEAPLPENDPEQELRKAELLKVCEQTIQQERSRIRRSQFFHRLRHRAAQFAAVLAVTVGLTGVVLASNESLCADAINWAIEVYPKGTSFLLGEYSKDHNIAEAYVDWLPFNFTLEHEAANSDITIKEYSNNDGGYIMVLGIPFNHSGVSVDTEDCVIEPVQIKELNGTLYTKSDGSSYTLLWLDSSREYFIEVYSEGITREELLTVAQNISYGKEE